MKITAQKTKILSAARTVLSTAAVAGMSSAAFADVLPLPAGTACTFPLSVNINGSSNVNKTFYDRNGNPVRYLMAGTGSELTFTNAESGATLSLSSNGSVTQIKPNPDGSSTYTVTGHNVLILFPADSPPGPTTTLYVGRVVFSVDSSGVFKLQSYKGNSTDICNALS